MKKSPENVSVLESPRTAARSELLPTPLSGPEPTGASAPSGWLRRSIPTLLVLIALGGLAYLGYRFDWTIPKFSSLIGKGAAEKEDWCKAHSVPESICVECKPALMPKTKSIWCSTHGVYDCPFENPKVAQLKVTPEVTEADRERFREAEKVKERERNNRKCQLHERRIQLASEAAWHSMGISIFAAERAKDLSQPTQVEDAIAVSGEVDYAQPRWHPLSTPAPGRVWSVVERGKWVKKGDLLALIDAVEVGKAKGDFLQAVAQVDLKAATVERLRPLVGTAVSLAQFEEAKAASFEAQARLVSARHALVSLGLPVQVQEVKGLPPEEMDRRMQFLGLPAEVVERLDAKTTSANLLPVYSPADGIVTEVKVARGERADPSRELLIVVDNTTMWLTLNVRQEDLAHLEYLRVREAATGQPQKVRFRPDGDTGKEIEGKLVWTHTEADKKTRTIQVRADLPNRDGRLKAHTFGKGTIVLREAPEAVVVENEAVHWEGDCHVVFVRDKNFFDKDAFKVFHVRTVRPGARNEKYTEILAGLLPGEVVASKGSGALRSELLKGNIGEG